MLQSCARATTALLLLLVPAACDSGPEPATGATGPGSGGAAGNGTGGGSSGSAGGGGGGASANAGSAGSAGAAGSAGQSTTSPTLGRGCTDDEACADGLTCTPLSNGSGDSCKEVGRACSKPCTTDAECGAEGEALCVADCGLGASKRCAKDGFSGKIGETCSAKKTCQAGLSCLPFLLSTPGGGCAPGSDVCSKTCTDDASCSDLGPNVKCFGCGGTKLCGLAG